jgi:predicted nucleic acid-binding protein
MSSFGVVLDACVLFPAALRDTLLRAADANLYRLHWTAEILEETRRSIVAQQRATKEQAQRLIDQIAQYFPEAAITGHHLLVPSMTNDEGDRHVLAAAIVSNSQVIVTHNLKHFPDYALSPFNIEAQSPDKFLISLIDLAPDRMIQIIREQANDLIRPPVTIERVLDKLQLDAPDFVARIRVALDSS